MGDVKMWENLIKYTCYGALFSKSRYFCFACRQDIMFYLFSISFVVRGVRADAWKFNPKCLALSEMSNSVRVSIVKHVFSR